MRFVGLNMFEMTHGEKREQQADALPASGVAKHLDIAVACGGTGGHIFPGLATAAVLRARGHEPTLWLAGKDIENIAVNGWGGPIEIIPAQGLSARVSPAAISALWSVIRATRECLKRMRSRRPHVLLAMGSYASVGPALAARRLGIPVVLHEANAVPGRACRFLAPWASVVAAAFDEAALRLRTRHFALVGMPVRDTLGLSEPGKRIKRFEGIFTVLAAGGSRGAHGLNEIVCAALKLLVSEGRKFAVIHLAGSADASALSEQYAHAGVLNEVHAFLADMKQAYLSADFAVCRAGASTCAELAHFGMPSLLVPYPHAINAHQSANASVLAAKGAANVVEEKDLTPRMLADHILAAASDPVALRRMGRAAATAMPTRAAEKLADLVEKSGQANA